MPEQEMLIIKGDRGEGFIARRKSRRLIVARFVVTRAETRGGERLAFADENFRPKMKKRSRRSELANELTSTCRYFSFSGECRESYRVEGR